MSAPEQRGYHFRTPEQWRACLFDRADFDPRGPIDAIRPLPPFGTTAQLLESDGACAPAVTRAGDILWHDKPGFLHRFSPCLEVPEVCVAPYEMAQASRLVSLENGLWVIAGTATSLVRFDAETLSRLAVLEIPGARLIDIAGDLHDALFVLAERDGVCQVLRVDCAGRIVATVTLECAARAVAFAYLRRSRRFVVLTAGERSHLYWFAEGGGAPLASHGVAGLHPCFVASHLGSDSRSRVFLAGTDGGGPEGPAFVLVFDDDGVSLSEVALDREDLPVNGLTGSRDSLLVGGARGLLRYQATALVPEGTAEIRCALLTPVLLSPDREDHRRWLRLQVTADLPEGATLEISYATTHDEATRKKWVAMAADESVPAAERVRRLRSLAGTWHPSLEFHGGPSHLSPSAAPLSAPLFDVQDPYVVVCVTLIATAGGALPALRALSVLYPGRTLMENLPAIYRRAEAQPGSFLRSFVGVLESTTQDLDARIAALGSYANPATAPGAWLDFLARWLGVPWDDALGADQKRRILVRASLLARGRGTRAGLETLLECLMPGTPPRFRVIDSTADVGFATVGGDGCSGSVLPAMLSGDSQWSARLDSTFVLGRMRLHCDAQPDDDVSRLAGRIRVDVAATGDERAQWSAWLPALINAMVPMTARVRLRWVGTRKLQGDRLDGTMVLEAPPPPRLGSDAITGVARLPERPSQITATGADTGTRLQ